MDQGLLELTRNDYYKAKLTLFSMKPTLVIPELKWRLVDIDVFIIASIDKISVINNLQSSLDAVLPALAFTVLDQRLKKLFAAEMLSRLHLQLKGLPHFASIIKQVEFKRGQSLKLGYWKDSSIMISVAETGVIVKPSIPLKVVMPEAEVFVDLPDLLDKSHELNEDTQSLEAILKKALQLSRLNSLTEVVKEYYSSLAGAVKFADKLYFSLGPDWRVTVDCCALTGQKIVSLDGEKSAELSTWLEQGELFRRWNDVLLLALDSQLRSISKRTGTSLSRNPLRFNRSYYSRLAEGEQKLAHEAAFVRYIELDAMVPSSESTDFHTFAVKLEGDQCSLNLSLVDFVNTTEKLMQDFGNWVQGDPIEERVIDAIIEGRRALMVKKLPLLLLAYPS